MSRRHLISACVISCALTFGMSDVRAGANTDPLLQAQELITTAPGV